MCLYLKLSYPSIRINTGQGFLLFFVFYYHCGFCPLFFFYKKKGVGMSSRERFVHVQWPCFCFDLFPSCFLDSQHQPSFCPRESDELWQRNVYFFNLVFFIPETLLVYMLRSYNMDSYSWLLFSLLLNLFLFSEHIPS